MKKLALLFLLLFSITEFAFSTAPNLGFCVTSSLTQQTTCCSTGPCSLGTYCTGENLTFSMDQTYISYLSGIGGTSVYCSQWIFPGNSCSSPTACSNYNNTYTCSYSSAGTYNVTLEVYTLATGILYQSSTFQITIISNPQPVITGNTSLCFVNSVNLDAGSGYTSYLWSTGATTQVATMTSAGVYTVTVSNANSCTGTASVTVTPGSSFSIIINGNSPACPDQGILTAAISGNPATPYTINWQDGNGATIATGVLTIGGLVAGNYSCTLIDVYGCSATASYSLSSWPSMSLTLSHIDATWCNDPPGQVSVSVSGGTGPFNYLWSDGTTTATNILNGLGFTNTYTVTVTDAQGCTKTGNETVYFFNTFEPEITGPTSECSHQAYNYYIHNLGIFPPNTVFTWTYVTNSGTFNHTGSTFPLTSLGLPAPLAGNTIVVTAYDNGCILTSAVLTIQACCTIIGNQLQLNDDALSYFNTQYANGGNIYDGTAPGNNPDIIINGSLFWDENFTFLNGFVA